MSEQKKISVGAALLAFGIGGAFAGACCGAIQGAMFVLLLTGFGLYAGFAPAEMQLVRFALVFLFGCLGGIFGMLRTERRHH